MLKLEYINTRQDDACTKMYSYSILGGLLERTRVQAWHVKGMFGARRLQMASVMFAQTATVSLHHIPFMLMLIFLPVVILTGVCVAHILAGHNMHCVTLVHALAGYLSNSTRLASVCLLEANRQV